MLININEVEVPPGRFREKFDRKALDFLKSSIASIGQLSTIVVEGGPEGKGYILRAGHRRLMVIKELHDEGKVVRYGDVELAPGAIAAVDYYLLTPLQRLEIEVEENIAREDFDWKERTRAITALHRLREAQHPEQTLTATASEILGKPAEGDQVSQVSDALLVERHLDDPDVAAAKNQRDAVKIIKRKAEAQHRARLAVTVDTTRSPHTLIKGDSFELIKTLPAGSFDVIVTDPPYGVDADKFGTMSSLGHDYKDTPEIWKRFVQEMPDELARVSKPQAHAYIFCDQRNFKDLSLQMLLSGWEVFPTMLLWYKGNAGMLPLPEHGPRRCYEAILYAFRGGRKTLRVAQDVIPISPVRDLKHGAQKPVALYTNLFARSARPGDAVLDCFGGTGPILVAANCLKLTATYIEENDDSFNYAKGRINTAFIDDGAEAYDGLGINL